MKKIFLTLLFALLLPSFAMAKDLNFNLPEGMTFGSDISEVKDELILTDIKNEGTLRETRIYTHKKDKLKILNVKLSERKYTYYRDKFVGFTCTANTLDNTAYGMFHFINKISEKYYGEPEKVQKKFGYSVLSWFSEGIYTQLAYKMNGDDVSFMLHVFDIALKAQLEHEVNAY